MKPLFFLFFIFVGCGDVKQTDTVTDLVANDNSADNSELDIESDIGSESGNIDGRHKIPIPIEIIHSNNFYTQNGFSLTAVAASQFSMVVDSCISGLSENLNENDSSIYVYQYDQNCLVKLTSFTVSGGTYEPTGADPFTNWGVSDTAIFANNLDSSDTYYVEVIDTLSSVVQGSDTINYRFSKIDIGNSITGLLNATTSSGVSLVGGAQSAPSFTLFQTTLSGETVGGVAEFEFILECTQDISINDCVDISMADLSYLLIEDTYSSVLNHSQAESLFSASGISVDTATDVIAIGSSGTTYGGFATKTGASVLQGPGALHAYPNMILIIKVEGATDNSYLYFNIDIAVSL